MHLSVIIVSYNVKYFLEQCLFSVYKAIEYFPASGFGEPGKPQTTNHKPQTEVFIVDNASSDGTVEYLADKFPFVQFLINKENIGFAKANNQALQLANGEYVLFLNPDTIVPENCFSDFISLMESQPRIGALGVRMIDGSGRFLAESKRGFPTAWRSFCKLSGLSGLLPGSKLFAGYNLGHLHQEGAYEVDALAGAFMLVRKNILDEIGGFDERFFMYAEDIDLSKRIMDAGYSNGYAGNHAILHFKGESTKKDKRYVKLFYKAMTQYVQKHYNRRWLFPLLMKIGIGVRSMIARSEAGSRKPEAGEVEEVRFYGDIKSIRLLKAKLLDAGLSLLEKQDAGTIIFCEGENFSFKQFIDGMQILPEGKKAMIHAAGSNSIVGSFNKSKQGIVIPL